MIPEIEKLIGSIYQIPYSSEAPDLITDELDNLKSYVERNHFLKSKKYLKQIDEIWDLTDELSSWESDSDRKLQLNIQRQIANLARTILEENKKIFVVHGRNIVMRDRVSALLGKLKLDYVILESEHNNGATIIEKFLRCTQDCGYAIVLFSADDQGKLNQTDSVLRYRTRQNVILELGYFLASVGRKNIAILHEAGKEIEKPSDFDGIIYEPFDDFGAWKTKLMREMKKAGIHIDKDLAEKV